MNKFWSFLGMLAIGAAGAVYFREELPLAVRPPSWQQLKLAAGLSSAASADPTAMKGEHQGAVPPIDGQGRRKSGPTSVRTLAAATGALPMDVGATGWAEPADITTIGALQSGPVVEILVQDGQEVKKGDVIARQDDRSAHALVAKDQANLTSDHAALSLAEAALQRAQNLLKQNVQSEQGFEQAKAARDSAAAKVEADKATLTADQIALGNLELKAPYDGRLGNIATSPGAYLSAGASVVTITRYDPIYVTFRMPQRYLPQLQKGLKEGATADADLSATGGAADRGKLSFFDNSVDQASGTVLAKAEFENGKALLWPGESLNITVHFMPDERSLIVPTVAVRQGADGPFVYTVDADSKVHATKVAVGRSNGDQTAIASGLSEGQHVVVEGQVQLADGQTIVEQFAGGQTARKTGETEQASLAGSVIR
ncbi:efflux RND transporter periplasmic adaptor subunit [Rhizobium helianthi]|uniref:Efflux RND transporter periplasmic adaptor subunit n=1 Tax=Rhizobium helianthi TaxID=1132695 RepID=A0ABW4M516_9HYPH